MIDLFLYGRETRVSKPFFIFFKNVEIYFQTLSKSKIRKCRLICQELCNFSNGFPLFQVSQQLFKSQMGTSFECFPSLWGTQNFHITRLRAYIEDLALFEP